MTIQTKRVKGWTVLNRFGEVESNVIYFGTFDDEGLAKSFVEQTKRKLDGVKDGRPYVAVPCTITIYKKKK